MKGRCTRRERRPTRRAPERRRGRRGWSILEITVAVALLTIALCGITGSIVASDRMQNVNRESTLAEAAVRNALEMMRGVPFATAFARYNSSVADDPASGASPGADFAVEGLTAAPGDLDGMPGEIVFPVVNAGGVPQLREDVTLSALGMPRDLNGDTLTDNVDHSADYRILPVRVQLRWSGANGIRTLTAETVLCAR